jgi:transposase
MPAIPIIRHVEPEELRRLGHEQTSGRVASRMFAIANVLDGLNREDAATHAGMGRQSLRDWVHRFNAEGVASLKDIPRKGRPRRMHAGIEKVFANALTKAPMPEQTNLCGGGAWICKRG